MTEKGGVRVLSRTPPFRFYGQPLLWAARKRLSGCRILCSVLITCTKPRGLNKPPAEPLVMTEKLISTHLIFRVDIQF
jgi:hypothetical protein